MDDATLRARLQDLREGHTGDPDRGAAAFTDDARWRDQADRDWIVGRDAIRTHLAARSERDEWDPTEVVVEGTTALVRYRNVVRTGDDEVVREGWARLELGEERLRSWDALWTT